MGAVFDFTPLLAIGSRVDDRIGKNVLSFEEFRGLKATAFGATSFAEVRNPFVSKGFNHPFPQLFRGKGVTLLADATEIFLVDEADDWSLSLIKTFDINDIGTEKAVLAPEGAWQFVDFHENWFLLNGRTQVFHLNAPNGGDTPTTPLTPNEAFVQDDYASTGITITTACDFRGRMISGGFDATNYWNASWQTIWANLLIKGTEWGFALSAPDANWVGWSAIGGGDLVNVFLPATAQNNVSTIQTGHNAERPRFLDMARRNEAGFMPMDWQDKVLRVHPLRNHVIVFGESRISIISPFSVTGFSTFGLNENMLNQGIASRSAVGGTLDRVVFVDFHGTLWSVTNDLGFQRLGFEEFFGPMIGTEITISHDPDFDEFYISNKDQGFVFNSVGVSEAPQKTTSVVQGLRDGVYDLLGVATPAASPSTFTIRTAPFTIGEPFMLGSVEVISRDLETIAVKVLSRFNSTGPFETKFEGILDTRGKETFAVSGKEFKVELSGTLNSNAKLSSFSIAQRASRRIDMEGLVNA